MRRYKRTKYIIFIDGRIKNQNTGRFLKPQNNGNGYFKITFTINGEQIQKYIHRLVGEYYVSNPNDKSQINHKDGNKLNNHASNLEWATNQENRDHAVKNGLVPSGANCYNSKLTKGDIEKIRSLDSSGFKRKDIASIFHVSKSTISEVLNGKRYKNLYFALTNKELTIKP